MLHVRGETDLNIPCEEEQDACDLTRLKVTENGIYMPDEADGYYQVDVDVDGYPEPTGTINITQNGVTDVKDYASADVNVPNSYSASDEGKVVSSGALVAQGSQTITQNGTYDTTLISQLIANIEGGGGSVQGFELYFADVNGGTRSAKGALDNKYFTCFFHDNMSSTYVLNGTTYSFTTGSGHNTQTRGAIKEVTNTAGQGTIFNNGSSFSTSHNDTGSYISVGGGWVGYADGGTIYENMSSSNTNSITMNSAHSTLLIFVGASQRSNAITSVDINGETYELINNGAKYDSVYGEYNAIVINNNTAATITVTFPQSCYSYVSIVGID